MNKKKVESEEVEAGDPESMEKSVLLLKNGQLNDIAALHEGFNLKRMPQNYLNKRSCIEKLIFHATMSDALKSPFSGFTIANRFLRSMDSMNVISGIRSLKALAKIALPSNRRTSVMVHRIGNTWLLDEFDTDSFLLAGEQSRDWRWLRKFLIKKNIFLCAESFSRNTLILRDLYIKFLYHTVNQSPHMGLQISSDQPFDVQTLHRSLPAPSPNDSGSELDPELTERVDGSSQLTSSLGDALPKSAGYQSQMKESLKRSWTANPDEFLHTAKWQLQDLSFLVGSDLAIFGTPKHPCISLKLSPMHESINVLTGIDIWLENILNEVPEVAMCYHHEGIVMQEYELYKTCDIPAIAGFETKQIYRIVQNIIMFLKRNATQEGHTYWLVKEPECGLVKLYDLTTLCENDRFISELDQNCDDSEGINPFILPVATLCYRLAELRWNEHQLEGEAKPVRAPGTNQQTEHQADNLTDALRLARNCLNVISLAERGVAHSPSDVSSSETKQKIPSALDNLKARAILLLCRLYLATPYSLLSSCIQVLQTDIKPCFGVSQCQRSSFSITWPNK
ncbi:Erythroid differentiation factor 1 isoform 1 [Fasciola hepatica]|uniref:Erythroid differentiation factor 1 isoform 1 n=1 Tax=Fasciola hepatica TaxID=6192 RepID=A0A4E0R1M5_FASHE|nr:Erythroid differentiation factor 1 isoform 1 [Fasciola hepatica]